MHVHSGTMTFVSAAQNCSSTPPMEEPPADAGAPPSVNRDMPLEEATPVRADAPPPQVCGSSGAPGSAAEKTRHIGAYAVQCRRCSKLRLIPTLEEYEAIRHKFIEDPWVCSRKPSVSCDDPADLDFDATSLWIVDKPNIPKTPVGCKRLLTMRKDFIKMDAIYVMPNGKRTRSFKDVEKFLEAYPEYRAQFSVPDFCFSVPKVMEGMFPGMPMESGSTSRTRRKNKLKGEDLLNVNHGA